MSSNKPAVVSLNRSSSSASTSSSEEETEESTNEEISLIDELEQAPEIACRYTERDPDFAEEMATNLASPAIVSQWAGGRQFHGGRGRGRGNSGGSNYYGDRKRRYDHQGGGDEERSTMSKQNCLNNSKN